MEDTKRIFQMTVCNLGRVFFNGDVFTTINEVTRLAVTDREAFFEGLEMIKKHVAKMETILSDKPKKKRTVKQEEPEPEPEPEPEEVKKKRGRKPKS
jgi:flagellar biosynthesis regulator FlbT